MSNRAAFNHGGVLAPAELRRIWDAETRKGKNLLRLAPTRLTTAYRELRLARRADDQRRLTLARDGWDAELTVFLVSVSDSLRSAITDGSFAWKLAEGPVMKTKKTFSVTSTAETYVLERVLVNRLYALMHNRASLDRSMAVRQVATSISDHLPKSLYRADIKQFYESIPHDKLISRVEAELSMPPEFRALIILFLDEYSSLAGRTGVPRGTALGAALAEYYLAPVDDFLSSADTLLHVRYVDDLVAIVGEIDPTQSLAGDAIASGIEAALNDIGLAVNTAKTRRFEIRDGSWSDAIEYLGYELTPGAHRVRVKISAKRMEKLHSRIERTFDAFSRTGEEYILLDRIKLLTGNTRLRFNKQQAMVGIYFSNRDCTDSKQLAGLDHHLQARLSRAALSERVRVLLDTMSFVRGFDDRTFYRFSTRRLRQMKGAWDA